MTSKTFKSKIGIHITKWDGEWMVTMDDTPEGFENFHQVENRVKKVFNVPMGSYVKYDSEYSQFVAYTNSRETAVALATQMERVLS